MILDKPDTSVLINGSRFGRKLLVIILMLLGLVILNVLLIFIVPQTPLEDVRDALRHNTRWIAQLIFGFTIFALIKNLRVGIPVAILSAVNPLFGSVFYLITTSLTED